MRCVTLIALPLLLAGVACGGDSGPKKLPLDAESSATAATALDHTPGYFRDLFRILEAQADLDDASGASLLQDELVVRSAEPGELPALSAAARNTLDGLLTLALGAVQQTAASPAIAREIGRSIFEMTLGLDPALVTFNQDGGQAEITTPGAAALADAALLALRYAADDAAVICASTQLSTGSSFDPGEPEIVWVDGSCEDDEWVDGYCESDEWIEGDCYEEWVPENCTGGEWVDEGYYEYYCYDEYDCDYIWREYWVYYDGVCDGGYWEEWCDSGRWEPGLCYDGYWIDGVCEDGHFEYTYPDGSWELSALSVPEGCSDVRPQQYAIAIVAAQVIADKAYDDLDSEWRAALDALLSAVELGSPEEAVYTAVVQILEAAGQG